MKNHHKSLLIIIVTFIICTVTVIFAWVNPSAMRQGDGSGVIDFSGYTNGEIKPTSIANYMIEVPTDISGYIKYTLHVNLPASEMDIFFRLPPAYSNYKFYVNGEFIISQDVYSPNPHSYPAPHMMSYHTKQPFIDITYYTDNNSYYYESPYANFTKSNDFLLGTSAPIKHLMDTSEVVEFAFFLVCILYSYTQFMEYLFRRNELSHLLFAIYSLCVAAEIMLSGQSIYRYIFPGLTLEMGIRVIIIAYTIRNLLLLILTMRIFHIQTFKYAFYALIATLAFLAGPSLFLPVALNYYSYYIYQIISIICLVLSIALAFIYYHRKALTKICYFICGCLALLTGNILSAMLLRGLTSYYGYTQISFVAFIIFANIWTTSIYNESIKNVTTMSQSMKEIIFKMQENKSTFITSHLRPSTINNSLQVIRENIDTDQETVDQMIQALSKYLRHTLDFSSDKLLSGLPDIAPEHVDEYLASYTIEDEIRFCESYITLMKKSYPSVKFSIECDESAYDTEIPRSSIQMVIENSLFHAFGGVLHPEIKVSVIKTPISVVVSIYDNGKGMTKEEINHYLSVPSLTATYGLYHLNQELIDDYNSELWIDSKINRFTHIRFILPLTNDAARKGASLNA